MRKMDWKGEEESRIKRRKRIRKDGREFRNEN